jgi:hypothetical protein
MAVNRLIIFILVWKRKPCKKVSMETFYDVKVPDNSMCTIKSADDNAKCVAFCKASPAKEGKAKKYRRHYPCRGVTYVSSTNLCMVCHMVAFERKKTVSQQLLTCATCTTTMKICKDKKKKGQ